MSPIQRNLTTVLAGTKHLNLTSTASYHTTYLHPSLPPASSHPPFSLNYIHYLLMNNLPLPKPMALSPLKHGPKVFAGVLIPPPRAARLVGRGDPFESGVGIAHDALPEIVPAVHQMRGVDFVERAGFGGEVACSGHVLFVLVSWLGIVCRQEAGEGRGWTERGLEGPYSVGEPEEGGSAGWGHMRMSEGRGRHTKQCS